MKKRNFVVVFLLFLITFVSFYIYNSFAKKNESIILYGNVEIRQVNLGFRVGGRLSNLNFEEGEIIKKGELLATLDEEPILNKLNQAKAQLKVARVKKENIELLYNRNIELCRNNVISKQKCDDITASKKEVNANYEYVKSIFDEAERAYNDCKLFSPNNGVILVRVQEVGSMLSPGTPVYILSLNDKMWVRAYINEKELGKVKSGSKAVIYTDSGKIYNGHIGFISPVAEFTPKNIETTSLRTDLVYRLRIIIDDADDYLKQGMPITVTID